MKTLIMKSIAQVIVLLSVMYIAAVFGTSLGLGKSGIEVHQRAVCEMDMVVNYDMTFKASAAFCKG